ncbi:MAG: Beta-catenin-like protein 1, partial [Paramarteilia canceri]
SKSQLKRIIKNQDKKQSISPLEIQNIGTDKRSNVSDSNYEAKLAKLQNDNDNEKYEADQIKTTLTTPQLISHLKSAYANNQMLRMKYAEDAEKFLQSELNLHDSIQDLRQNVVNTDFFGALLQFKAISTFLSILNHENN